MQGILIVDKPMEWTSFDVIAKLRGILGTRKLGHSGTLDPMATGVLPVFCGGASKAVDLQLDHTKTYCARLRLGMQTDTGDITGTEHLPEGFTVSNTVVLRNDFYGNVLIARIRVDDCCDCRIDGSGYKHTAFFACRIHGHNHGFGGSSGTVVHRSVADVKTGERGHHALVLKDVLQSAL